MKADWQRVDGYLADLLVGDDPALAAALAANAAAGLPAIDVSPLQGKLLHLLARLAGARRILEIGTLGGYSTIWLARALPEGGRLVTLEAERRHAEVARANIARAGLADRVELIPGPALDTLPTLEGPFDLVFIDADKRSNPDYLAWALRLSRPGAVIVCDNVIRDGAISRRHEPRPRRRRHPPLPRDARRRAAPQRHRRPDRRRQGLGRLRHRHRGVTRRGAASEPPDPLQQQREEGVVVHLADDGGVPRAVGGPPPVDHRLAHGELRAGLHLDVDLAARRRSPA